MHGSTLLAAALPVTGCSSQFAGNLRAAEAPCRGESWPNAMIRGDHDAARLPWRSQAPPR